MKSVPKFLIAFGRDIDLALKNANFSFVTIGGIVHCSARNPSLTTRQYVSRINLEIVVSDLLRRFRLVL